MKLAHPDSPVVRDAGALRSAAMLTCRWRDIALADVDLKPLEERYEEMAQLASLAIARAYYLEHEPRPQASVTSLASHRSRKEAPAPVQRPGA